MLMSSKPYFIFAGESTPFEVHRHPEMEICYCAGGECDLICEHRRYSLKNGDFVVIPPMMSHEIPKNTSRGSRIIIEIGSAMLGESLTFFSNLNEAAVFSKDTNIHNTEELRQLEALIKETAGLHYSDLFFRELSVKGNLYKIAAALMQILDQAPRGHQQVKRINDAKKIDRALEKIYNSYNEPLTVESVSAFCGYGKSNFCKIFKNITGSTFHSTLNRHRIEVACILLRESECTIEEVARETGFTDSKSYCRVFKKITGKNAGEYRKAQKAR